MCEGGGHDISLEVMEALRARHQQLRGETTCPGMVCTGACTRKVRFAITATFDEPPGDDREIGLTTPARALATE